MKNIVYFDLETQKSADEVGGWDKIRDLKMSVGVTYSTARAGYRIYQEREVDELIRELQRADLVSFRPCQIVTDGLLNKWVLP